LTPDDKFIFRLALALGKTVDELNKAMPLSELYKWKEFENEHLFPADLIDRHGAMLCSFVLNITRPEGSEPINMTELLLLHRTPPAAGEIADERTDAEKMASALGRR